MLLVPERFRLSSRFPSGFSISVFVPRTREELGGRSPDFSPAEFPIQHVYVWMAGPGKTLFRIFAKTNSSIGFITKA